MVYKHSGENPLARFYVEDGVLRADVHTPDGVRNGVQVWTADEEWLSDRRRSLFSLNEILAVARPGTILTAEIATFSLPNDPTNPDGWRVPSTTNRVVLSFVKSLWSGSRSRRRDHLHFRTWSSFVEIDDLSALPEVACMRIFPVEEGAI